jgi:hypothetical protein
MQSTGHTAVQDASLQHDCVMTYGTHPPSWCLLMAGRTVPPVA